MTNSKEYYDWLQKFEKRNTSDDTFTPPAVYDIVLDYVNEHILNLDGLTIERPFYPNGDYQAHAQGYDDNTVVIDNPPFSILSKIVDYYLANDIKFFLFAPALMVFSAIKNKPVTAIISNTDVIYDNKAVVRTAFITNLLPNIKVKTAPQLYYAIKKLNDDNKKSLPKYDYPAHILTVNKLQKLASKGIDFEVSNGQCQFITTLDSQKEHKKTLFGGGYLMSDDKAKELYKKEQIRKQAEQAEQATYWALSDRELAIIATLT